MNKHLSIENNAMRYKNLYHAQCLSVGRIGGVGSHWWHVEGLKSGGNIMCF